MMELIDRGTLLAEMPTIESEYKYARKIIQEQPTVDAEPVKHGKWIVEYEVKDGRSMRCSECQMVFWVGSGRNGNYCPNCGAKMEAEEKGNEE